jgi:hypothetical protein
MRPSTPAAGQERNYIHKRLNPGIT